MKAVLVPRDLDGSGCYRVLLPARELRFQRGWDARMAPHRISNGGRLVTYCPDVGLDKWLLESDFGVVWWQPRTEPWAQVLAARVRAQGKRVLVDVDDAWWGLPAWNPGSQRSSSDLDGMRRMLGAADGLSVATPALAEMYLRYQPNIRVIRNRLDWRMWEHVTPVYEQERRRVRIGWMGETRWRAGDLEVLKPWFGGWLARHPECVFVAAGDPRVHDLLEIPDQQRVTTGRVEFQNFDLADITATFDIGLVPLDLSTPEARRLNGCKSHLKGLEYNACGIPFVATPTESYRWYAKDRAGVGLLASSPDEWVAALEHLIECDRTVLGAGARAVAKFNSLQHDITEWEDWVAGDGSYREPPRPRELATGSMGQR